MAFHLFSEMQTCRVVGNELTYSAIISACEKGRNWKLAGSLLPLTSQRDVITVSSLLSTFQQADQWEEGLCQLSLMRIRDIRPNAFSINSLLASRCDGYWRQPLSMLGAPIFVQVIDEISYNSVMMSICEEVQQWSLALELLRSMGERRLRPNEAR